MILCDRCVKEAAKHALRLICPSLTPDQVKQVEKYTASRTQKGLA
jgi:hypothetical protein